MRKHKIGGNKKHPGGIQRGSTSLSSPQEEKSVQTTEIAKEDNTEENIDIESYLSMSYVFEENNNVIYWQDFQPKIGVPHGINFKISKFFNNTDCNLVGFNNGLMSSQTNSYGNGAIIVSISELTDRNGSASIKDDNIGRYVKFGENHHRDFHNIQGLFKIADSDRVSYTLQHVGDPLERPKEQLVLVDKKLLGSYLKERQILPIEYIANNIDGLRDALKNDDIFYFYKGVVCNMMTAYNELSSLSKIEIGDYVKHLDYNNSEFEIVGISNRGFLLKGDWSGGTHNTVSESFVEKSKVVGISRKAKSLC